MTELIIAGHIIFLFVLVFIVIARGAPVPPPPNGAPVWYYRRKTFKERWLDRKAKRKASKAQRLETRRAQAKADSNARKAYVAQQEVKAKKSKRESMGLKPEVQQSASVASEVGAMLDGGIGVIDGIGNVMSFTTKALGGTVREQAKRNEEAQAQHIADTKPCHNCGDRFYPRSGNQLYCTPDCRKDYNRGSSSRRFNASPAKQTTVKKQRRKDDRAFKKALKEEKAAAAAIAKRKQKPRSRVVNNLFESVGAFIVNCFWIGLFGILILSGLWIPAIILIFVLAIIESLTAPRPVWRRAKSGYLYRSYK